MISRGRREDLVLRERWDALRRGDLQDAGVRPRSGTTATERYGVTDPKAAPFSVRRPGELARPHRVPAREQRSAIVLEMLGVTLSGTPVRGPIQLPAWNEALGLPRPWTSSGPSASSRCWLRDRPARVRRHLRGRGSWRRGPPRSNKPRSGRARGHPRARRRVRSDRGAQVPPRSQSDRAPATGSSPENRRSSASTHSPSPSARPFTCRRAPRRRSSSSIRRWRTSSGATSSSGGRAGTPPR